MEITMNGYLYSRHWFNFRFENPDLCKPIHTELYLFIVDKWNRLGQKKKFGLPTGKTMEVLNIGSYNTYKNALKDLVNFGFINIVKDSKNQHSAKIVALSKNDKASDKALDKATDEADDEPTDKPTDTIVEQKNKRTKEIIEYLNEVSGKKFKHKTDKTKRLINARIAEGYSDEDFKYVINKKTKDWKNDPEMSNFIRPETLFGSKFEGYLNEKYNNKKEYNPLTALSPL